MQSYGRDMGLSEVRTTESPPRKIEPVRGAVHDQHPPEFQHRAVEIAWLRKKPVAEIAKDRKVSESRLRNKMSQANINESVKEGLMTFWGTGRGSAPRGPRTYRPRAWPPTGPAAVGPRSG